MLRADCGTRPLESSKGYARETRDRTRPAVAAPPGYVRRSTRRSTWWHALGAAVVVKQDGLAAGKGVIVPDDDDETIDAIDTLIASRPDRARGAPHRPGVQPDGAVRRQGGAARCRSPRITSAIGEGDTGPNTGGMGAYAPAPTGYDADALTATFVQPVIDHLAAAGTPYVGVLYAGLMLTADGPRLIEFNCRFGDPEAQAVLPLFDSDLAELALACCNGALADASTGDSHRGHVHGGRGGARLPGPTRRRADDHRSRRCRSTTTAHTSSSPAATAPRSPAVGCSRSPGLGESLGQRPATTPIGAWRPSTSTACRFAATSAGAPPARR